MILVPLAAIWLTGLVLGVRLFILVLKRRAAAARWLAFWILGLVVLATGAIIRLCAPVYDIRTQVAGDVLIEIAPIAWIASWLISKPERAQRAIHDTTIETHVGGQWPPSPKP